MTHIIITGAAGGIGEATARLLADAGHPLVLVDRAEAVVEVAASLPDAVGHVLDVGDEADVTALFAGVDGVAGLVNCAATMSSGPITETSLADWNRVLTVNATGTFLTCREAVRAFVAGDGGAIVNLSSISGRVGLPRQPAYCASKGAVVQLSKQIAADFAGSGVRCNVVSPGSIETPQLRGYLASQPDPAAAERALVAGHPAGRIADAQEVASVIAFLLGPSAAFMNGADVAVDGGYTAV